MDEKYKLTKFELNKSGVRELLHSSALRKGLEEIASDISRRCGGGYSYDTYNAGTRVIASAYTESSEAMNDNYNNNTILKAISSYRYD